MEVTPRTAFFGFLKIGAKAMQTIALKSRTSTPFRVLKIEYTDPKVIISKPQQRNGGGYDLALTLATRAAAFIDVTLNIQTDVPGEEILTVPVTALVE